MTREEKLAEALETISSIISRNIKDNGTELNRMKIGEEYYTGPVVDSTFKILKGLEQIANTALSNE